MNLAASNFMEMFYHLLIDAIVAGYTIISSTINVFG